MRIFGRATNFVSLALTAQPFRFTVLTLTLIIIIDIVTVSKIEVGTIYIYNFFSQPGLVDVN